MLDVRGCVEQKWSTSYEDMKLTDVKLLGRSDIIAGTTCTSITNWVRVRVENRVEDLSRKDAGVYKKP